MFENIRSGFRLIPTNDQEDAETLTDLGIYEDEESRADRMGNTADNTDLIAYCPTWFTEFYDTLPSLSLRERLLGCGTCMIAGYILSFGSFMRIKSLLFGNPVPIVVHVTVGNIIALCGTCFLSGPQAQMRRMLHKTRKLATTYYLGSLVVTMFLLLLPHFPFRNFLLFMLMIGQYVAITWYCLSYIPFARQFVTNGCRRLVGVAEDDL